MSEGGENPSGNKPELQAAVTQPSGLTIERTPVKKGEDEGRWDRVFDAESGDYYYWHTGTRETTWDKPVDFIELEAPPPRAPVARPTTPFNGLPAPMIILRIHINVSDFVSMNSGTNFLTMKFAEDCLVSDVYAKIAKKLLIPIEGFAEQFSLLFNKEGEESIFLQATQPLMSYQLKSLDTLQLVKLSYQVTVVDLANVSSSVASNFFDNLEVNRLLDRFARDSNCKPSELFFCRPSMQYQELKLDVSLNDQAVVNNEMLVLKSRKKKKRPSKKHIRRSQIRKKATATAVFGQSLVSLMELSLALPAPIHDTTLWLRCYGMNARSLFLNQVDESQVLRMKNQYDGGTNMSLDPGMNPYVVAKLLIQFFAELPTPLIPWKLVSEATFVKGQPVEALKNLPREHLIVLSHMAAFFSCMQKSSTKNLMTKEKICGVFGPVLVGEYERVMASTHDLISHLCAFPDSVPWVPSNISCSLTDVTMNAELALQTRVGAVEDFRFLPGEEAIVNTSRATVILAQDHLPAELLCTTYKLLMRSVSACDGGELLSVVDFDIPLVSITSIERKSKGDAVHITISSSDFRSIVLVFRSVTEGARLLDSLSVYAGSTPRSMAFANFVPLRALKLTNPLTPYSHENEFVRQNAEVHAVWKLWESKSICRRFAQQMLIPVSVTDDMVLAKAANFVNRSLPVLLYHHPRNGAVLLLSGTLVEKQTEQSQSYAPSLLRHSMMGESTRSMLLSTTSFTAASNTVDPTADAAAAVEEMLTCYRACSPSESLHCICLGSSKSGKDISAMPFMPLDEQVAALRAASLSSEPIAKSSVAALQKTWLACVSEMLINSLTVGLTLEKGGSILLQDNQFLHYPVTSLGLLVIDPFYRTIEGFRTLIDHVWRHSNYPFCMQSGIGAEVGRHEFLLFLDCTWQIWMQFPNAFEFTDELLVLLCRALYSGRYGTFLANNWEEHVVNDEHLFGVWQEVTMNAHRFTNPLCNTDAYPEGVLKPNASVTSMLFWGANYRGWVERTKVNGMMQKLMERPKNTSVNLRRTALSFIPNVVSLCLRFATYISFERSGLTCFPVALLHAPGLKDMNLSGNAITHISAAMFALLGERCPELEVVNLRGNPISDIHGFGHLTNVRSLNLSQLAIRDAKSALGELSTLTKLEVLSIDNWPVSTIPPWLFERVKLRTLTIEKGALKSLPSEIGGLSSLAVLNLSSNMLTSVPASLRELKTLTAVNLSGNKLEAFPEAVLGSTQLRQLLLADNLISSIPNALVGCAQLQQVDLSNNRLSSLPPGLGELHLADLRVSGNVGLPASIKAAAQSGTTALLKTLQDQLHGTKPLRRMRLMMVGQENVGKTTVLRGIRKEKVHEAEGNISTDGIDINSWDIRLSLISAETNEPEESVVNVSAWDFAGQEIYYDTHQLFMSERSVFVLVWNIMWAEQDSRIEFWLQSINARTHSPVILVATHIDDPGCTKEYHAECLAKIDERYGKRFPNIRAIMGVSCSTGKGMAELRHVVKEVIAEMPQIQEQISNKVLLLESELRSVRSESATPVMTWQEFENAAMVFGLRDKAITEAAKILHLLGSIVHFDDEVFRDLVVLDSSWLTNLVASIITTKHRYVKDGMLKHSDLLQIWRPPEYPVHLHPVLRRLLQKFEVIYELDVPASAEGEGADAVEGVDSGKSLVPCMLPLEKPQLAIEMYPRFASGDGTQTSYTREYYFNFVPRGLISHLIIRLAAIARGKCFWRNGVVAETRAGDLVLLELQEELNELTLSARGGDTVTQVFVEMVDLVDSFITDWFRLDVQTLIPCPHCLQECSYDPHRFELNFCREAAMRSEFYVLCGHTSRSVRLDMIVPEVSSQNINKVEFNAISVEKQVGKGGFATVFRAKLGDEVVAVKRFDILPGDGQQEAYLEFMREVWIMSGIHNPYVVQFKGLCTNPLCIITDFAEHGNLYDFLHNPENNHLSTKLALKYKIAFDIAQGMRFLHNRTPPVVHGDLKSPNILLVSANIKDQVVARVADFGLSRMTGVAQKGRKVDNPVWLAPEILAGKDYNEKADVYAYGVILFEILTLQEYSQGYTFMSALEDDILRGKRPPLPQHADPELKLLITDCWDSEPKLRPSFEVVLQRISLLLFSLTASGDVDQEFHADGMASAHPAGSELEMAPRKNSTIMSVPEEEEEERRTQATSTLVRFHARSRHGSSNSQPVLLGDEGFIRKLTPVHDSAIHCMTLAGKGELVWAGCQDGTIHSWRVSEFSHARMYPAHTGVINSLLPIGDNVWSCSIEDRTVRIWDGDGGKLVRAIYPGCELLCLAVVGDEVWAGTPSSRIMRWHFDGEQVAKGAEGGLSSDLCDIALAEVAKRMAHKMTGVDPRTHKIRFKSYANCFSGAEAVEWLLKHADCRNEADAVTLAQRLMDQGNLVHVLQRPQFTANKKAFYRLANVGGGQGEGGAAVTEEASGFQCTYARSVAETGAIKCILYDEETDWVWMGTDRSILVLARKSLQLVMCLAGHGGMVNAMVMQGECVWSGSNDTDVCMWNRRTGDLEHRLSGHTGPVTALMVEGAAHVWSASADRSMIVWSASGEFIKEVKGRHEQPVSDLLLVPHATGRAVDQMLFTSSYDCFLRAYHCYAWDEERNAVVASTKRGELKEDIDKKKKGRLSHSKVGRLKASLPVQYTASALDAIKAMQQEDTNVVQLALAEEATELSVVVGAKGKIEYQELCSFLFSDIPMYTLLKFSLGSEERMLILSCATPAAPLKTRMSFERCFDSIKRKVEELSGQRTWELLNLRAEEVTEGFIKFKLNEMDARAENPTLRASS